MSTYTRSLPMPEHTPIRLYGKAGQTFWGVLGHWFPWLAAAVLPLYQARVAFSRVSYLLRHEYEMILTNQAAGALIVANQQRDTGRSVTFQPVRRLTEPGYSIHRYSICS